MQLRDYQKRVLGELEDYFKLARTHARKRGARGADRVRHPHRPALPRRAGHREPALRLPARAHRRREDPDRGARGSRGGREVPANDHAPTVLWLAPSNAIVSQTLRALRDRDHWYRRALDEKFAGNVKVMDLGEALSVTRADLTGAAACVIVTTFQALRVDNTEGRKVYESNAAACSTTSRRPARGTRSPTRAAAVTYSLANRAEHAPTAGDHGRGAQRARTELSFDTLVRFRPSAIVELTATPQRQHDPKKGLFASNILGHVSAAELKAEHMIKLPIRLRTEADWRLVVRDALDTRRQLAEHAAKERAETGEYIRPIILFRGAIR